MEHPFIIGYFGQKSGDLSPHQGASVVFGVDLSHATGRAIAFIKQAHPDLTNVQTVGVPMAAETIEAIARYANETR